MNNSIKMTAWNLLLECGINKVLDIEDIEKICTIKGWNLISYSVGKEYLYRFKLEKLSAQSIAITHYYDSQYTILYDNNTEHRKLIMSLAKQIGNIMLIDSSNIVAVGTVITDNTKETVFQFACELYIPSIILGKTCLNDKFMDYLVSDENIKHYYRYNYPVEDIEANLPEANKILKAYEKEIEYLEEKSKKYKNSSIKQIIKNRTKSIKQYSQKLFYVVAIIAAIVSTTYAYNIYSNYKTRSLLFYNLEENIKNITDNVCEKLSDIKIENPVTEAKIDRTNELTVYITKTGKKYHIESCQTIRNKMSTEIPIYDAVNMEYEPCLICNPDKIK